jgi:hypothetical protein
MIPSDKRVILSSAYLPNIQYFSKLLNYSEVIIEINDTYQKQSFRNRCTILGANGPLDLVIPVKRLSGNRTMTKDIMLDYDMPWQKIHWKAIISAYKHSAFFDIFEPEISPLFYNTIKYLVDFNFKIIEALFHITGNSIQMNKTTEYLKNYTIDDFRESIHPKVRMQVPDSNFEQITYFQIFSKKRGFTSNLSFIDLLFNEGPQAIYLCKQCMKKRGKPTRLP